MLKDQYQLLFFMEKAGTDAQNVIRLLSFGKLDILKSLNMSMAICTDMNAANYLIWNKRMKNAEKRGRRWDDKGGSC